MTLARPRVVRVHPGWPPVGRPVPDSDRFEHPGGVIRRGSMREWSPGRRSSTVDARTSGRGRDREVPDMPARVREGGARRGTARDGDANMFVVAGVTGNTGRVVAELLLSHRHPVRVVVRDEQKTAEWRERG